jgi:hypothetical protein
MYSITIIKVFAIGLRILRYLVIVEGYFISSKKNKYLKLY